MKRLSQPIAVFSACVILLMVIGCAHTPHTGQPVPATPQVLIVNSDKTIERYATVEQTFTQTLRDTAITHIDLASDKRPAETVLDALNKQSYAAIYTIGAKALGAVDFAAPDSPVIFSSVLNWPIFSDRPNYYGVATELAPEAQLAWVKLLFPGIKRIGVLYDESNRKQIQAANQAALKLGLTIIGSRVDHPGKLNAKIDALLTEVDMLWLIPTPTLLSSSEQVEALFSHAENQRKPVFAYHDLFMGLGATLALSPDQATIGRQAGIMAQTLLRKPSGAPSKLQYPAGSSISLNLKKAQSYQLKLNEAALDSVSELVHD